MTRATRMARSTPPTSPAATCPWTARTIAYTAPATPASSAVRAGVILAGGPPGRPPHPCRRSLPLDRSGRLRRDVEHHPVDLADLVDHPRGDPLEQVVGQTRPVGGHRVVGR